MRIYHALPKPKLILILALWLVCSSITMGNASQPLKENTIRLPVIRDTWLSSYKDERDANLGGENRLKAKGILEFSLVDFNPKKLRGRVITGATLHVHCRSEIPL